mmetsp:Transcript_15472/g.35358  ORF Transcript_15472/g.35358 Transcript_15472/m.35358 type:complete len:387 (-) Transcript_15472:85-1245(-)
MAVWAAGAKGDPTPLERFLTALDPGLKGAFTACLAAVDVGQLLGSSKCSQHALADPGIGVCCPHLRPLDTNIARMAVEACDAPQVRTLRPHVPRDLAMRQVLLPDYTAVADDEPLSQCIRRFTGLEELGPLALDADMALPASASSSAGAHPHMRNVADLFRESFQQCTSLRVLSVTISCLHLSSASLSCRELLDAIGGCQSLAQLDIEIDTALPCGAKVMRGVESMLKRLSAWRQLEFLSLGYLWWTEASTELLSDIRAALMAFDGSIHCLTVAFPQDPELGALEAACNAVEGVSEGVAEIRVAQAWAYDGDGLGSLAEVLGSCTRLSQVELVGPLPTNFDACLFAAAVRAAAGSHGASSAATSRHHAVLSFDAGKQGGPKLEPLW